MNKKKIELILCAAFAIASVALLYLSENYASMPWAIYAFVLLAVLISKEDEIDSLNKEINVRDMHINKLTNDLGYLANSDTWKQIRACETQAQNCYHYLMRIGQLKARNRQLEILNNNLINNFKKGVKNYARTTKR